ncbi:MAG: tRNA uridine-5-carboxymethylaminomethyl(34) synthesis GTPase MnmE [Clostridiales bacterium]|nr:MAG: tRNA uridine-5-carboxymethylaminomethyl(34) synthesis GTPase MnmE [Clostridiales bacterium]
MDSQTTIAAISTPLSPAGIGMVRLSGPHALDIAQRLVRPADPKRSPASLPGYSGLYGRVYDQDGEFDEAVVFVYRAPKSYTGEDVAEVCCHGGAYLLRRTLSRCFQLGASPAGPGEFTKRAFLNGKLSLTQAEAVAGLIAAQGSQSVTAALAARDGALQQRIERIAQNLVHLSASLAAWIDYPDEEQDAVFGEQLAAQMRKERQELHGLLEGYERGRLFRDGIVTAIVGKPNVGKSTLMNLLAGRQKSIVTAIPGTTRDVVESRVMLGDILLELADTAGIRETDDPVEAAGVDLARSTARTAQLVLVVLDSTDRLQDEDRKILEELSGKPAIAVINKTDAGQNIAPQEVFPYVRETVAMSAQSGDGVQQLEEAVLRVMELDQLTPGQDLLISERQLLCAQAAHDQLAEALEALENGMTFDAINVCLDCALDELLVLTGQRASEAVVDEVFSKFCVGK